VDPSLGAADPIFPEKKTGDLFIVITVSCQFCSVTSIYFLLKNWRPFLWSSLSLLFISLVFRPLFPACCYVTKNAAPFVGAFFVGGPCCLAEHAEDA